MARGRGSVEATSHSVRGAAPDLVAHRPDALPERGVSMSQLVADDNHPQGPQQRYANLYTDLARTVRELGLLRRRHGYYWTRIGLVAAAFAAVWAGIALLGNSWLQLLMAGALAL